MYDLYYNPYTELYHHGVKGQKWGVRRYQNSDGSLTDEGRRRYGFGSEAGKLMTQNTKSRLKTGVKIGAAVGAGAGAIATGASLAMLAGAGAPITVPAALSMGAAYMTSFTASGVMDGIKFGGIFGVVETQIGRNYIRNYDKGLADFEMRELKR